jgi:SulP family sulfate permease
MKFFDTSNLRGDITGGLTAGIVALPLALAFGEASGAGPIAGLWGAIIVGFFAALFGGTNTQITGPTGPMIVVFAAVFGSLNGQPEFVFAAVVLAGLIQILFGVLKLGQYIRLVPYPVISGFMSGIGVIIILLQTSRLFGHEPQGRGTIPALQAIPDAVIDPHFAALSVGLVTLGVIFFWPKSIGKYVPGALAALIIGTILSLVITAAMPEAMIPILGDIPTGLPEFVVPGFADFSSETLFIVTEAAILLALLGAIDSLLTSLVADNMTRTRHHSERELIGQGIGNTIAGFFGAIPGAGATMRTVVNIRSGGGTRISGMIHSLILVAVVFIIAPIAAKIPHAVLAGILVKVGYDIIDVSYLKNAHRGPRWDLALMALVLLVTVFWGLIEAVALGVFLAALGFVKQLADEQLKAFATAEPQATTEEERAILDRAKGRILLFEFGGPLSFGAAADLGHQVRERSKSAAQAIILDFSSVPFMDVSAARAVETIACDADKSNKIVYVTGMSNKIAKILNGLDADQCLPASTRYDDRLQALQEAIRVIEEEAPKTSDGSITAAE